MHIFKMFITAVCFIFLIKLRWPKTKSLYATQFLNGKGYLGERRGGRGGSEYGGEQISSGIWRGKVAKF